MLHAVLYEEAFQFHCDRADGFQPLVLTALLQLLGMF